MTTPILNVKQSVNQTATSFAQEIIGDYAKDASVLGFVREQRLAVSVLGAKPNTRMYVFFDKVNVSAFCRQTDGVNGNSISNLGGSGPGFYTNSTGDLHIDFYCPGGRFFAGHRQLELADVSDIANIRVATTHAVTTHNTFDKNIDAASVVSTRGVTDTATPTNQVITPISLAQSFYIGTDDTFGKDGLSITAIDLFFQAKDSTRGVTVELVTVDTSNLPTNIRIPFSTVHKTSAEVSTAGATKFTFDSPVYLRAGYLYAISIRPDALSPNYRLYTAVTGEKNTTDSIPIVRNWGEGSLFTSSTSATNWTAIPNEYLEFNIYKAVYNTADTTTSFTNADLEFLKIANVSSGFYHGEHVFLNVANATGNIAFSNTASNVTGYSTTFSTTVAAGNRIVVSNGSAYDVLTVNSVANNTSLIVKGYPKLTANSLTGSYKIAVLGRAHLHDNKNFELTLEESNAANATFCFTQGGFIRGVMSGSTANIVDILDREVHKFQPQISTVATHGTRLRLSMRHTRADNNTDDSFRNHDLKSTNFRHDVRVKVMSKTNEILNHGGNKSLTANVTLSSDHETLTPFVDKGGANILSYTYKINNNSYGENKRNGLAAAKYISRRVTLAEGLDSEDIQVYLTSYRPPGTDLEVYAKILNSADPEVFEDKDWSLLQIDQPDIYSDLINQDDTREYKYTFLNSPPSFPKPGSLTTNSASTTVKASGAAFMINSGVNDVIKIFANGSANTYSVHKIVNNYVLATGTITCTNTSTTVTGTSTIFNTASAGFEPGSRLYLNTTQNLIGVVSTIANSTSLTLTSNALLVATTNSFFNDSFIVLDAAPASNSTVGTYEKLSTKNIAFANPQNDGIVRYYSASGAAYDTYKSFAIKIVMKSENSNIVPRVLDLRVIALSV